MAIQINGGLLSAMTRPAWGRDMSEGIKGMFAETEKAKMLKPLMENSEMFQQGVESQDARLSAQAAQNLMETGKAQGNVEMYQQGMKMRQAVPQIKLQGQLKGIDAIDKALKRDDLDPRARVALEERRNTLMQGEGVGAALQQRQEAKWDYLKKQDAADAAQHMKLVDLAENAIIGGVPESDIVAKVGASVYKDALKGANDFKEQRDRAIKLKSETKTFSKDDERFQALSPIAQKAVTGIMETNGHDAALGELNKQYQTLITQSYAKDKEQRAANISADAESIVASMLDVSNTDAWLDKNKDLGQWYEGLEPKEKENVRKVALAEAKRVRMGMEEGTDLAERRETLQSTVQRSIEDMYNRTKEVESQSTLRDDAPTIRGLRSQNTTRARRERAQKNREDSALTNYLQGLSDEELAAQLKAASEAMER